MTAFVDMTNHELCLEIACLLEDAKVNGQLTGRERARLLNLHAQVSGRVHLATRDDEKKLV